MLSIASGAMLVRVSAAALTVSLLVKSTVVLALAHVAALALKRRPAAERHALWLAVLASIAALPIMAWIPLTANLRLFQLAGAPISGIHLQVHAISTPGDRVTLLGGALTLWLGGTLLMWLRNGVRLIRLWGLDVRGTRFSVSTEIVRSADYRRHSHVSLLTSAESDVPFTWGMLHPGIILPAAAVTWSAERLRSVLAHESAHIIRHDWLTQTLAEVVVGVYWFHPLAWHALRQLKREQEHACDDHALNSGIKPCAYASELLALARGARLRDFWTPVPTDFARNDLEVRMKAILDSHTPRRPSRRTTMVAMTVVTLAVTLALTATGAQLNGTSRLPASSVQTSTTQIHPDERTLKGIQPPQCISCPEPLYPKSAKDRKVQGTVTISAVISLEGQPLAVRVKSSPDADLSKAAVDAIQRWRFQPGTLNEKPVEVAVVIEFGFRSY